MIRQILTEYQNTSTTSRKTKRFDTNRKAPIESDAGSTQNTISFGSELPSFQVDIDSLLSEIVDAYFQIVQPWISILHEPSFWGGP